MREELDQVLAPFRPGFDADGFDVTVASVGADGSVVIAVRHRPNACEECLLPDEMLAGMLTKAMQRVRPSVMGVVIRHDRG